jgi:Protein of unknown function (DUF2927)
VIRCLFFVIACLLLASCAPQVSSPRFCNQNAKASYTHQEKEYFAEIALGSEFGSGRALIHKWGQQATVAVRGNQNPEDVRVVQELIEEINLAVGVPLLRFTEQQAEITIYLAPRAELKKYEPHYVNGNDGFFWLYWSWTNNIHKANIVVDEGLETLTRHHVIREELTQSLGLANDSYRYEESIFFQAFTSVTTYSATDRAVMEMLYRCDVASGMNYEQLPALLK